MEQNIMKVTTCLPKDIWKIAMMNDIVWTKALKLGIEAMLNVNKEKKLLEDEKLRLEVRLKHIKDEIDKLTVIESKKKKEENENVVMNFES